MKQVMDGLGAAAQADALTAARADLGGSGRFSGWRQADALGITVTHAAAGEILLNPAPNTAAAWAVADRGRHQGGVSGPQRAQRATGPTLRGANGRVRQARASRGRGWNGTTQPKNTVSDYLAITVRETPARAEQAIGDLLREAIDG